MRKKIVYPTGHPYIPYINSAGGGGGVKEVYSFANLAAFPATGVVETLYIALDTNKQYRWYSGSSSYVELIDSKLTQVTGVSVSVGAWSGSTVKEASISNAAITANSVVTVIPDNASYSIVKTAEFYPRTDSSAGAVKIYAVNIPSGTITVTLNIQN